MVLPGHCEQGYGVARILLAGIYCFWDTVSRDMLLPVHSKEGYGVAGTL